MHFLLDIVTLIGACVVRLAREAPGDLMLALGGGLVLATVCWFLCSRFSRLFNLQYHVTPLHHVLCGVAAVFTLGFTVAYVSLAYLEPVALVSIETWSGGLLEDRDWSNGTSELAYDEVYALGLEDFSSYPHPRQGGTIIPASTDASQKAVASVYSREAVRDFGVRHPVLSLILRVPAEVASALIDADIKEVFTGSNTYSPRRAIDLAVEWIKRDLTDKVGRVEWLSRLGTVLLFGFIQGLAFGLIGYAAYSDLKAVV